MQKNTQPVDISVWLPALVVTSTDNLRLLPSWRHTENRCILQDQS